MVKNVLPNEYLILDNYIDLNLSEFLIVDEFFLNSKLSYNYVG